MASRNHLEKKRHSVGVCQNSQLQHQSISKSRSKSEDQEDPEALRGLLISIYEGLWNQDQSMDSDTLTENSCSGIRCPDYSSTCSEAELRRNKQMNRPTLLALDAEALEVYFRELQRKNGVISSRLVRQLKRRDQRKVRLQKKCDMLTAILQASSLKRRQDTQLKFTVEPKPGEEAFQQWKDAMKAVARLPLGLPVEFRKKVWLALANQHISSQKYDWDRVRRFAFNDHSNPDDHTLGLQIVKDLHRTGCERFSSEADRAVLKRVLLAYARWNKRVGYCQGFNVLAALILEVTERQEDDALKVMVYLVDHILPESYFGQSLQALSVDMAVFRDLLRLQMPDLAKHLEDLQKKAVSTNLAGTSRRYYEPPLTNVFTMQWFLTLFATCLPPEAVLRVWDTVLLQGSEVMLRTALAIWESLAERVRTVDTADVFYTTMGQLTTEMAEGRLIDTETLLQRVYSIAPFPFPGLAELREKYTYDITPFSSGFQPMTAQSPSDRSSSSGLSAGCDINEDELDDEDLVDQSGRSSSHSGPGCFAGFLSSSSTVRTGGRTQDGLNRSFSAADISQVGPGAMSAVPSTLHGGPPAAYQERMTTNLSALQAQYQRLRNKQRKTSLVIPSGNGAAGGGNKVRPGPTVTGASSGGAGVIAINHLLLHRQHGAQQRKGKPAKKANFVLGEDGDPVKGGSRRSKEDQDSKQGEVVSSANSTTSGSIRTQSSDGGPPLEHPVKDDIFRGQLRSRTITITSSNVDQLDSPDDHTDLTEATEVFPPVSPAHTSSTDLAQDNNYIAQWVDSSTPSIPPPATVISPSSPPSSSNRWQTSNSCSSESCSNSSQQTSPNHQASSSPGPFTLRPQLVTSSRLNFGSKFGLYKAMTHNPAARQTLNDCLNRTYMAQLRQDLKSRQSSVVNTQ